MIKMDWILHELILLKLPLEHGLFVCVSPMFGNKGEGWESRNPTKGMGYTVPYHPLSFQPLLQSYNGLLSIFLTLLSIYRIFLLYIIQIYKSLPTLRYVLIIYLI